MDKESVVSFKEAVPWGFFLCEFLLPSAAFGRRNQEDGVMQQQFRAKPQSEVGREASIWQITSRKIFSSNYTSARNWALSLHLSTWSFAPLSGSALFVFVQ